MHVLLMALALSLGINVVMLLVAFGLQSDKPTDTSYAVTFIALAIWGLSQSSSSACAKTL